MRLAALIAALALSACAAAPKAPEAPAAPFRLTDLSGETVGRGAFDPIFGSERAFTAYLNGYTAENGVFVLEEEFVYEDGETDRKTWRFTPVSAGIWSGVREDVVGTAQAYRDGAAFRLDYRVELGGRVVRFRDVLYSADGETVVNRAQVSWRGLPVGRVRLEITPAQ